MKKKFNPLWTFVFILWLFSFILSVTELIKGSSSTIDDYSGMVFLAPLFVTLALLLAAFILFLVAIKTKKSGLPLIVIILFIYLLGKYFFQG